MQPLERSSDSPSPWVDTVASDLAVRTACEIGMGYSYDMEEKKLLLQTVGGL